MTLLKTTLRFSEENKTKPIKIPLEKKFTNMSQITKI